MTIDHGPQTHYTSTIADVIDHGTIVSVVLESGRIIHFDHRQFERFSYDFDHNVIGLWVEYDPADPDYLRVV